MKTIIFIDSHATQNLALIAELENLGHKVSAFSVLDEAYEDINQKTPDLIIISDSLGYSSIENFINKLKNLNNYEDISLCIVARDSYRYQNLNVEIITPPLYIEKLQFLLKKKKNQKPLDQDIFSEVLQDVLGEKKVPTNLKTSSTQELEHKIDILKKDSHILLQSKDKKILDLKRKIDSLELEISELNDKIKTSHETTQSWHEKSQRALKALKLAVTQLEETDEGLDKFKKSA